MKWELVHTALEQPHHVSGIGYARVNCPYCAERVGKVDHSQCLSVRMSTGWFRCWRCGVKGRLPGFSEDDYQALPKASSKIEPPEGYLPLMREPAISSMAAEDARDYLRRRRIDDLQVWEAAAIGCCLSGRYQSRVVVPILSPENEWLGWVARSWVKGVDRKYLNAPGMSLGATGGLFNQQALWVGTDKPLFVVEGVFDALALWPDAVAVLGKPTTPQVRSLMGSRRPVVMLLDGDAWEEAEMLAIRLRLDDVRAGWVKLPAMKDPDEVDRAWLDNEAIKALTMEV